MFRSSALQGQEQPLPGRSISPRRKGPERMTDAFVLADLKAIIASFDAQTNAILRSLGSYPVKGNEQNG